jgi:hypothetical protein
MWDDHDWVGNNTDGNISAEMRARLLAGYRNHIPHYPLQNQAGLWQQFTVGNVEFFMIDDRSQRRPVSQAFSGNSFNPPPGHSMLSGYPVSGTSQREWLFDAIRRSKARWKILVSPVFFNPAAATAIPLALFAGKPEIAYEIADKWVGYPAEVDSMKALFRAGYDRNFAIISGDAHTNIYDDGTHSLVPEFMVGNLDIANSKLDSMLRSVGFNIWTASQPGSERTIGRIRVETTPRHRLILESFDENGRLTLSYEMVDTSSTVGVHEQATAGTTVRSVSVVDAGTMLLIETAGLLPVDAGVTLYSLTGELVFTSTLDPMRQGAIRVALPSGLTVGTYLARITGTELDESFQVMVIR